MEKLSDLRKSLNKLADAVRFLGVMVLENPNDEIAEAKYELALRLYCKVNEKIRRSEAAIQAEITAAIAFGDEMHAAG